ncbi:MAG: hypothetical protein KI790_04160 [Cyclobacteriaceae bacterium]|nr:hypothetical protein [Cyclobacteriaceae bacterium HetDA_MAG_MS6]
MSEDSVYFRRYSYPISIFPDFAPPKDTSIIVVIPAFKELDLLDAIRSLIECDHIDGTLVILVVVNEPQSISGEISEINDQTIRDLGGIDIPDGVLLKFKKVILPDKKAGVGLARKIGMDEAARWFSRIEQDGIIVCYDSDCHCSPDYLRMIQDRYRETNLEAGIVFFEHLLDRFEIVQYELYLRYYTNALRFAGYPYAFQTLGSCITVRSKTYEKHGGMNTRKAGEDFYFLNKIIPVCRFTEINETTIYPSARNSDRVPFGTGSALFKIQNSEDPYLVYHPKCFGDLKSFLDHVNIINKDQALDNYHLPDSIQSFLKDNDFDDAIRKIIRNSASLKGFKDQFFSWFNSLKVLQFVHFARDHYYSSTPLSQAIAWLNQEYLKIEDFQKQDAVGQLKMVRTFDRKAYYLSGHSI